MRNEIEKLIKQLMDENQERHEKMSTAYEYGHTALVHQYNNTLDIVRRLNKILEANEK